MSVRIEIDLRVTTCSDSDREVLAESTRTEVIPYIGEQPGEMLGVTGSRITILADECRACIVDQIAAIVQDVRAGE